MKYTARPGNRNQVPKRVTVPRNAPNGGAWPRTPFAALLSHRHFRAAPPATRAGHVSPENVITPAFCPACAHLSRYFQFSPVVPAACGRGRTLDRPATFPQTNRYALGPKFCRLYGQAF